MLNRQLIHLISRLRLFVLPLFLLLASSCILNQSSSEEHGTGTGQIAPKIQFTTADKLEIPAFIKTVTLIIQYAGGGDTTVTVDYSAKKIRIDKIPVGQVNIKVQGKNSDGEVLYEGSINVTVIANLPITPTVLVNQVVPLIAIPTQISTDSTPFTDGDTTTQSSVTLSGRLLSTEVITQITWSDGTITPVTDGLWEKNILLTPGSNTITLTALTSLGVSLTETFKVYMLDVLPPSIHFAYPIDNLEIGTDSVVLKVFVVDSSRVDSVWVAGMSLAYDSISKQWTTHTQFSDTTVTELIAIAKDSWGNIAFDTVTVRRINGVSKEIKYTMSGNVINSSTQEPIPNALITVQPGNFQTTTNILGQYSFGNFVGGTYGITVSKDKYVTAAPISFSLPNDKMNGLTNFNFQLQAAPYSLKIIKPGRDTSVNTTPYIITYQIGNTILTTSVSLTLGDNPVVIDSSASYGIDSIIITLDTAKPSSPIIIATSITPNKQPKLAWASANSNSGVGIFKYRFGTDTSWYITDSTSFIPSPLVDGTYILSLSERDLAGNWSDPASHQITIDSKIPPEPTFTSGSTSSPTNQGRPQWSWQSSGGTKHYRYHLADTLWNANTESGWTITDSATFSPTLGLIKEGTYILYLQEQNTLGVWSSTASKGITLDFTKPIRPTLTSTGYSLPIQPTNPAWTWNGHEQSSHIFHFGVKGVENLSDTARSYTTSIILSNEQPYVFFVVEIDAAGNISDSLMDTVFIDKTPPNPPNFFASATPTNQIPVWRWQSSGGTGNFRYRLSTVPSYTEDTVTQFILPSTYPNSSYILLVGERDIAYNWSQDAQLTIVLDTVRPNPPTKSPLMPTTTNDTFPTWTWLSGGSDGAKIFRYKLGADPTYTITSNTSYKSITKLIAGTHTLYVSERDSANNWSNDVSIPITIDIAGPDVPKASVSIVSPTNDSTPTWMWSSGVGGTKNFRHKLDNATAYTTTPDTFFTPSTNLSHNSHTLYVSERDSVGNWSDDAVITIVVDLIAPSKPIKASTVVTPTNDSTPTWMWSSGGGGGSREFRYKLNSNQTYTVTPDTSYIPGSNLTETTHTLYVSERDLAGNWSTDTAIAIVTDYTKPNIPVRSPYMAASTTNDTTPTWMWSSGGNGGARVFRHKLNSNLTYTIIADTSYTPSSNLTESTHTLYVSERDAAGNWSNDVALALTIDVTGPNAPEIVGPSLTNDNTPTFTFSNTDDNTGTDVYQYRVGNGSWIDVVGSSQTTPTLTSANYTFRVRERDALGNWGQEGTKDFTVDAIAPSAPPSITTATSKYVTNVTSSFKWIWTRQSGENANAYHYTVTGPQNSSGTTNTTSELTISGLSTGNYALDLWEVDAAGNPSAHTRDTLFIRANVLFVKQDVVVPGDGSTWTKALASLPAVNSARYKPGITTEVWVAAGNYTPTTSDPNISFEIPANVTWYGGFEGVAENTVSQRNLSQLLEQTVLNGNYSGSSKVFSVLKLNTNNSALDGFKITGGDNTGINQGSAIDFDDVYLDVISVRNVHITGNIGEYAVIGIKSPSTITFENALFYNNTTSYGYVIFAPTEPDLILKNSLFYEIGPGSYGSSSPRFVYLDGGTLQAVNTLFERRYNYIEISAGTMSFINCLVDSSKVFGSSVNYTNSIFYNAISDHDAWYSKVFSPFDFRWKTTSGTPAPINAGTSGSGAPVLDIEGRPVNGTKDIGPYELQ